MPVGVSNAGIKCAATVSASSNVSLSPERSYVDNKPPIIRILVSNTDTDTSRWFSSPNKFLIADSGPLRYPKASANSFFSPIIYNVSSESIKVAPILPKSSEPRFDRGMSSSCPSAYVL